MLLRKFHFFNHESAASWFSLILIVLIVVLYFAALFLSRGYAFYYKKAKINTHIKNLLAFTQIGGSLVLALALPNNYLNEFPAINDYYTKNGLWIFASSILLFLIFVLSFGISFSLLVRVYTKEIDEVEEV